MLIRLVFAFLALVLATAALLEGFNLWGYLRFGKAVRAEKPGRYWLCVVSKAAGSTLSLAASFISAWAAFHAG